MKLTLSRLWKFFENAKKKKYETEKSITFDT